MGKRGTARQAETWVRGGFVTPDGFRERLRVVVAGFGRQDLAADRLRISPQYLCDVLRGRREPGRKLLDAMGYRRVVVYERRNRPFCRDCADHDGMCPTEKTPCAS